MTDDIKDAACSVKDCINALFFCFGPAHQFDRYYKDGALDDCKRQLSEAQFCFKLKAAGPEETKRMVRELLRKDESPTMAAGVWQARAPAGGK